MFFFLIEDKGKIKILKGEGKYSLKKESNTKKKTNKTKESNLPMVGLQYGQKIIGSN